MVTNRVQIAEALLPSTIRHDKVSLSMLSAHEPPATPRLLLDILNNLAAEGADRAGPCLPLRHVGVFADALHDLSRGKGRIGECNHIPLVLHNQTHPLLMHTAHTHTHTLQRRKLSKRSLQLAGVTKAPPEQQSAQ